MRRSTGVRFPAASWLLLVVGCLLVGCSDAPTAALSGGGAAGLDYPELYRSDGLPEYPGATLVDVGRQTTSRTDGLKLSLTTADDPATVLAFFTEQLTADGWQMPTSRLPEGMVPPLAVFTKGKLRFQMTFVPGTGSRPTRVTISYVEL
ncbi:MAG: hypothetical protein DWQ31_00195 [Planctomycetota bacterium]|nr:MAG: hypothetical protein DWQ31_00195 [Planctomycetota bacterium]REJ92865.1 MAG: hypothetical protein DWQ35_11240 [Planctomycetota bacterium]REK27922.1 MAG: hypothetical protein DWQ42_06460 [Planctomycetota bacterium]REK40361.1 MAG: hypothetical protein DWQ46_16690 [Planctomycetota bacterium]